jgi:uncharacterized protein YjiS (DUF1127 family)
LQHSQGSHAKIGSAKFPANILPFGQWFKRTEKKRNLRGKEMNLVRSYNAWRRYRSTVAELGRLTNRELNDLGINRGDIPFVAMSTSAR